ncbi:hypothetical protein N8I77_008979 [Diaporthe amygdali]|uniref:Translation initiation factor IF-3 n=1 Tax=Phomopsis amygdali TaxID=1214568 RepID=A0AAD9W016_PHOAM|nr:hypothetical protein N8I77_008979 [Diaporthe amygdali]
MPSSQCVFNTATALRRVFIPANLGTSSSLHLTRIFVPALLTQSHQARAYWAGRDSGTSQTPPKPSPSIFDRDSHGHTRSASGSSFNIRRGVQPRRRKEADPDAPGPRVEVKLGRMPRDEEIHWPYVYVKPAEGSGGLDSPRPIKEVLVGLDRKTTFLEAVALPRAGDRDAPRWPVCRIVNKKEELTRLKDLKERKKKGTVKEKELELNWTLAPHDLDHKLNTMQKFLSKGYKVEVVLQKKSRSKSRATENDAQAVIERIETAVGEVKGAKEWKKREGQVLGSYRLFLQGKAQEETTSPSTGAKEKKKATSTGEAEETTATSNVVAEESQESSAGEQSRS